jgi:Domain of unknown function (DUF4148)
MKTIAIATVSLLISAFAGSAIAATTAPDGLTRAQVRAQLVEAQRDGVIPTSQNDYPPTASQIAENRAVYQAQFGKSSEPQRWAMGTHADSNQG